MTVLFADVAAWPGATRTDPEDARDVVSEALARVITEVEGLGGVVTSSLRRRPPGTVRGTRDPRGRPGTGGPSRLPDALKTGACHGPRPALRFGVETGAAVGVGPESGAGGRSEYGAIGAVVGTAAALQAMARPGSVLVGPDTYRDRGRRHLRMGRHRGAGAGEGCRAISGLVPGAAEGQGAGPQAEAGTARAISGAAGRALRARRRPSRY